MQGVLPTVFRWVEWFKVCPGLWQGQVLGRPLAHSASLGPCVLNVTLSPINSKPQDPKLKPKSPPPPRVLKALAARILVDQAAGNSGQVM